MYKIKSSKIFAKFAFVDFWLCYDVGSLCPAAIYRIKFNENEYVEKEYVEKCDNDAAYCSGGVGLCQ